MAEAQAVPATPQEILVAVEGLDDTFVAQLTSLVAEARLTNEEVIMIADSYKELDGDAAEALLACMALEYEGFAPMRTIKEMLARHTATRRRTRARGGIVVHKRVRFTAGGEEKEFTITNDDDFKVDVRNILTLFLTRGASLDKIKEKSRVGIREALEILITKYGINTTKRNPGSALGGDVITVPRIAAAFPIQTVTLLHKGVGRILIKPLDAFPEEVPKAFFSPMVSSLIPKSLPNCHAQQLLVAIMVDDVLHTQGRKTPVASIWTYYLASFNSDFINEDVRKKVFAEWGLLNAGRTAFAACITGQKARSMQRVRELRPGAETEEVLAKIEGMA